MTRLELITLLVARARTNGFEFRRWYTGQLGLPWISAEAALNLLNQQRRYYALLFSHEFACAFWKASEDNRFTVQSTSYRRTMPDGSIGTVERKTYQRRSNSKDSWGYHLREMATAEEPLRYIRRFLSVEDELIEEAPVEAAKEAPAQPAAKRTGGAAPKPLARPMPTDTPAFLRQSYNG